MADSDHDTEKFLDEPCVVTNTDQSLLRRFQEGQQDAATALYVRYAQRLQALAKKQTGRSLAAPFDPEDVVQSVFRTFFRRASEGLYEVPVGEELWQLLLVLALNKIRTLAVHHRAQKRDAQRTIGGERLSEAIAEVSDDRDVAYETMRMVVDELVTALPPPQDRIVQLRIEGYEIQQIAAEVRRSKRTVERNLQQFRDRLSSLIEVED